MESKEIFRQVVVDAGYLQPSKVDIVWELATLLIGHKPFVANGSSITDAREVIRKYKRERGLSSKDRIPVSVVRDLLETNSVQWPTPTDRAGHYYKWDGKSFILKQRGYVSKVVGLEELL